ncbi:hypothetical protein R6Q57_008690 [Mikania cordata]
MVPQMPLLISFDPHQVRKQAAASTQRFDQGNPLSILDGIFMAVKDDIDCYPLPTKGGTTWLHDIRLVKKDGVSVSRLKSCGVIFVGKANMHELGMGVTGLNPHHGTPRNPHDPQRYTGGSSSGSAAIVASGICPAALGSDAGGSIRIPASLCGVVGLKTTYGRTDMRGTSCGPGTVEVIGPIASSVDDVMLVYAAMLGSSPADKTSLRPPNPCLPNLSSNESSIAINPMRLGKYTEWFDDVNSPDISAVCGRVLTSLSEMHGCEIVEITIPELQQMRVAHAVSYGCESLCSLVPEFQERKFQKLALDSRINLALFQSFTASDYVAAQRLRQRLMLYHMEIFKKVDIIVTPSTGMTAPMIDPSALDCGESDLEVTGSLMKFAATANVLGFPAISVPVGYDKQGLPIGLQLMGRPWCEATILLLCFIIAAPNLSGSWLRLFVMLLEMPLIGSLIIAYLKKQNKIQEMLRETEIPEPPMFRPEYPLQEQESGVVSLKEEGKSQDRVDSSIRCLPQYDPSSRWKSGLTPSFSYWKIRDYAYAYRSRITTPSMVAEYVISAIEEFNNNKKPPTPQLVSFNAEDVRKQAAASTQRFEEGKPVSALDGIFMAIKDDIDCYPYPSKGGTTWFNEVRTVDKDAVCVSRLRRCGVILVGKANMHEFGQGTTGNNPNNGTTRNPHNAERYTGGSSSGPAAIVASGICSAALGTDGGGWFILIQKKNKTYCILHFAVMLLKTITGSVRIPSSLCGVVGLKTTYGRTDITGTLHDGGTLEVIGPIASSVEDIMLVYAATLGASPADKLSLSPSLPCLPDLSSHENSSILGSMRMGKYSEWFNDVFSPDISTKCEDILNLLSQTHGCKVVEVVIPELHHIRTSHLVSIGSEVLAAITPHCRTGYACKFTLDTRTNLALFRSFTASDYVAAQRLRRRVMYYHMEIFKTVDVIVTPTTGMTAPLIRTRALTTGETNLKVTGNLMRFILAGNLIGLPAISVPVGYDKQGLPVGLQIIGRPWGEATILRLAAACEVHLTDIPNILILPADAYADLDIQALRFQTKKPASYFDVLKGH